MQIQQVIDSNEQQDGKMDLPLQISTTPSEQLAKVRRSLVDKSTWKGKK